MADCAIRTLVSGGTSTTGSPKNTTKDVTIPIANDISQWIGGRQIWMNARLRG